MHYTDPGATSFLQNQTEKVQDGEVAFIDGALQGAAPPDPEVTVTPCDVFPYTAASPSCPHPHQYACRGSCDACQCTRHHHATWTYQKTQQLCCAQIPRSGVPIGEDIPLRIYFPPCAFNLLAIFSTFFHALDGYCTQFIA